MIAGTSQQALCRRCLSYAPRTCTRTAARPHAARQAINISPHTARDERLHAARRAYTTDSSSAPGSHAGPSRSSLGQEQGCADVSNQLREVMRDVAQPVAIVTACTPTSSSSFSLSSSTPSASASSAPSSHTQPTSKYHGATLTSFTSLTLHPYPLVAFSLRLPSRLADCIRPDATSAPSDTASAALSSSVDLSRGRIGGSGEGQEERMHEWAEDAGEVEAVEQRSLWNRLFGGSSTSPQTAKASTAALSTPDGTSAAFNTTPSPSSSSSSSSSPRTSTSGTTSSSAPSTPPIPSPSPVSPRAPKILTVSLLSTASQSLAHALSTRLTSADQARIFASDEWDSPPASSSTSTLGADIPPGLKGAVGRLRCEVVSSLVLADVCDPLSSSTSTVQPNGDGDGKGTGKPAHSMGSELFICKVTHVEKGPVSAGERPLLYWKQRYATVQGDR